jgi:hypothetical protein
MSDWIEKHRETISILLVIGMALAAGVTVGFILILIANVIGIW